MASKGSSSFDIEQWKLETIARIAYGVLTDRAAKRLTYKEALGLILGICQRPEEDR
jgi:hypothetical protein